MTKKLSRRSDGAGTATVLGEFKTVTLVIVEHVSNFYIEDILLSLVAKHVENCLKNVQ